MLKCKDCYRNHAMLKQKDYKVVIRSPSSGTYPDLDSLDSNTIYTGTKFKADIRKALSNVFNISLTRIVISSIAKTRSSRRSAGTLTVEFHILPITSCVSGTSAECGVELTPVTVASILKAGTVLLVGGGDLKVEISATEVTDSSSGVGSGSNDDSGLSGGAIVGIIIGCLLVMAMIVGAFVLLKGRKAHKANSKEGGISDADL